MKLTIITDIKYEEYQGGAERHIHALKGYLQNSGIETTIIKSKDFKKPEKGIKYLVSNFCHLSEEAKANLIAYKNYVIYEHDHHYIASRNPAEFPDYIVPQTHIINIPFYMGAKNIICLSDWHRTIIKKNVPCDPISIGCSMWTPEDIQILREIEAEQIDKFDGALIINHQFWQKNRGGAVRYAMKNKIKHRVINMEGDYPSFIRKLAEFKYFIFMPFVPESFSRVTMEAEMVNTQAIVSETVAVSHEEWFGKIRGKDLIDKLEFELMPNAINIIKEQLNA